MAGGRAWVLSFEELALDVFLSVLNGRFLMVFISAFNGFHAIGTYLERLQLPVLFRSLL